MNFYKRVSFVCQDIPYGKVVTYGQIALLCGKPKNARQVGYALNHKITENNGTAHRVVNSQGYLSGAGAFATPDQQRKLLLAEGVKVDREQKVDLKKYGWINTIEDAVRLRSYFEENGI